MEKSHEDSLASAEDLTLDEPSGCGLSSCDEAETEADKGLWGLNSTVEGTYCGVWSSSQKLKLEVPVETLLILKEYARGAIRTQPKNLHQWTCAYFLALARNEMPPVKDRYENPSAFTIAPSGLTVGVLRVLNNQLSKRKMVREKELMEKWTAMCMEPQGLDELLAVGGFQNENMVEWNKLLALASGSLAKNLVDTMRIVCEVITKAPDGTEPLVIFEEWWEMYKFLSGLDGTISPEKVEALNAFLQPVVSANYGLVGPKDFLSENSPIHH